MAGLAWSLSCGWSSQSIWLAFSQGTLCLVIHAHAPHGFSGCPQQLSSSFLPDLGCTVLILEKVKSYVTSCSLAMSVHFRKCFSLSRM